MSGRPLNRTATVVLDAAGAGQVAFYPTEAWRVSLTSVSTATATLTPIAKSYRNSVGQSGFLEGTAKGSGDTSDSVHRFAVGEAYIIEWVGGDNSTRATVRISGLSAPDAAELAF